jgi:6-phosphogluconolactonase
VAELRRFANVRAMADDLADLVTLHLSKAVRLREQASMVCAGGTTPGPVYDLLSQRELRWDRIHLVGSDERWLAPDDPDTLDHLLHDRLLKDRAADARFTSLLTGATEPEDAEEEVDARLAALPRPFDLTLLGMGADGHTASLFPRAEGLEKAMDLADPAFARAVRPADAAGSTRRMSLTLSALLDSRLIVLMFRGRDKLAVYETALEATDPLSVPVSAILRQDRVPVLACWAP